MSKIIDKIKAIPTNAQRVSDWVDIHTSFKIDDGERSLGRCIEVHRLYSIEVKLGATALISQHEFDHIGSIVDGVKRAVIEELYGEFRKPLLDLEHAIAGGSQKQALEKVRQLYRDMFGLGVL